ncbi:guanine-1-methyltransferase-domain-containing protein [Truncatella angustata]|uniref:tRNA (guanine(9)-N1)-methyltransferase n=1 Tax=Truncatella angustata TaxID=152316 RepID=A0A9P8UJ32_9PEZI|nr:guanine-1-methyltransferase-domain-containing protein [Truncatella angustata]KAH6653046.1 guanine-1-methyltransferase-domain-containing protein [Truncatella angustata]
MSKNQLRKLKRQKLWEEKKADRKDKRKEKRHNQQDRRRQEKEAEIAQAAAEGREPVFHKKERSRDPKNKTQVPVSIIIDCQYEDYMFEKEQISLSSQVTRSYSDNRTAQHPVHLCVSSFGGKLKQRFDTTLVGQYQKWKGITFAEDDFPELEADDVDKSIVYLTADSPYVLDRLEPNTNYVIGGIIDRNRHKGLCYKVARERNVRTAKLPIGEYMVLQDRHVLATNHVVEIMLRWLELGDWGEAFMKVIPQRKGGKLKDDADGSEVAHEDEEQQMEEAASPFEDTAKESVEP